MLCFMVALFLNAALLAAYNSYIKLEQAQGERARMQVRCQTQCLSVNTMCCCASPDSDASLAHCNGSL